MVYKKEVNYKDLLIDFDFLPEFKNTNELKSNKGIIGQERAIEAIEFGLSVDKKGYNIFILGSMGTGKRSYILDKLKNYSQRAKNIKDWCYLCNFNDPYKPKAIWFKSGDAYKFKKSMDDLLEILYRDIPKIFSDSMYERERNNIVEKQKKLISRLVEKLQNEAEKNDFKLKSTSDGYAFIPAKYGKEMTEEEYDDLGEKEKDKLNKKVSELKILALDVIKKTKEYKKIIVNELRLLDRKTTLYIINDTIDKMKNIYSYNDKIIEYIDELKEDIIENIDAFIYYEEEKESEEFDKNFFNRYSVNILVSSNKDKVPVIFEKQPDYNNLIGTIEYENKRDRLITDFTMIKPGSLHKANGGYIIIEAEDILKGHRGWEALKRSLKTEKISIGGLKTREDSIYLNNIEPDDIELDVKVILLGTSYLYYLLYNNDDDFKEFFKIKAEFDDEIKNSTKNTFKIVGFISNYCTENNMLPINRDGIKEILRYSCREADNKMFFTGKMGKIVDLIEESNILCRQENRKEISGFDIKSTINNIEKRFNVYKEKTIEKYLEGVYVFDIKNFKVGEINGLSVIDVGDFKFGKQSKITATTYASKIGIVNIEREVSMSGSIHSKGVLILSGYFNENFGKDKPISFGASLCFEQLYGGVDGDSASLAELMALISSLSETPINQGIAVTGSINQKGIVQPVGGVNEKIEGFFDVCNTFELDGTQGVILPKRNLNNLILKDDIVEAVKKGLFHIYPVETIEEGFNIITSKNLNSRSRKNIYNEIKEKVCKRLELYNEVNNKK